jgi:hypothetical protein
LSHLQPLQQLTNLNLAHSLTADEQDSPPAAAYAALTASSKLQHLDLTGCTLQAGAWQHMLPACRQLPQLLSLDITWVRFPSQGDAPTPEFSSLVSCCPSLQSLYIRGLQYSAERLALLQGLSTLHTLYLNSSEPVDKTLAAVGQLTGLHELYVDHPCRAAGVWMLPLTQLKQLTELHYTRIRTICDADNVGVVTLTSEVSGHRTTENVFIYLVLGSHYAVYHIL